MKNPFRQFFIPTPENGLLPYALHPAAFAAYLICAVAFLVGPAYVNRVHLANLSTPYRAYTVVELVNASRQAAGLPPLKESNTLDQVAADKARDIFEKQYFAHMSPDAKTPWDFLKSRNYFYSAAGENLAIDYITPEEVHQGLMASPTHRANILNKLYTEIGVAVFEGTFDNRPSVVVVQYFGTPRATAAVKPAPAPIAQQPQVKGVASSSKPVAAVTAQKTAAEKTTATPAETPVEAPVFEESTIKAMMPEILAEVGNQGFPVIPVASLFLLSAILIALTFILTRREMISAEVALRVILFVLVFGYISFVGGPARYSPTVTPAAFSVVVR